MRDSNNAMLHPYANIACLTRLAAALLALGIAAANAQTAAPAPEAATGRIVKNAETTKLDMVAAANPLAAKAGKDILAAGGSAVDAAIAVQLVLALVEPQSSGLGGGALLVHFDGKEMATLDGRETAPAAAIPERFLWADGKRHAQQPHLATPRLRGRRLYQCRLHWRAVWRRRAVRVVA